MNDYEPGASCACRDAGPPRLPSVLANVLGYDFRVSIGETTWLPSHDVIAIYAARRERLATFGIDVSGLAQAIAATSSLPIVGVRILANQRAQFVSLERTELSVVALPTTS